MSDPDYLAKNAVSAGNATVAIAMASLALPHLRIGQLIELCFDDGVYDLFTVSNDQLVQLLQDLPSRFAVSPILNRLNRKTNE